MKSWVSGEVWRELRRLKQQQSCRYYDSNISAGQQRLCSAKTVDDAAVIWIAGKNSAGKNSAVNSTMLPWEQLGWAECMKAWMKKACRRLMTGTFPYTAAPCNASTRFFPAGAGKRCKAHLAATPQQLVVDGQA